VDKKWKEDLWNYVTSINLRTLNGEESISVSSMAYISSQPGLHRVKIIKAVFLDGTDDKETMFPAFRSLVMRCGKSVDTIDVYAAQFYLFAS
jgi:hypothetical protein